MIPSFYTRETFTNYLEKDVLMDTAKELGWFTSVSPVDGTTVIHPIFDRTIDNVLMQLGESDITTITGTDNIGKLRLYGRREIWKAAMQALASDYSYTTDSGSINRFQIYVHVTRIADYENDRVTALYNPRLAVSQQTFLTQSSKVKAGW